MERIISVTDLVRNAARIAKEVETEGTVFRITRGGRGSMVLVDQDYFEGWMAALDEMRRPGWQAAWERSGRDIAEGRLRSLDVVAKELGLEGTPHRKRHTRAGRSTRTGRPKSGRRASSTRRRPA